MRQGGYLVVSELSWIEPDAPDELRTYLEGQYPAIKNTAENMEIIRQADYDEVASFVLPESGWWDDFYNPLQRRIDQLRHKYAGNLQASMVLDDGQLGNRYVQEVFAILRLRLLLDADEIGTCRLHLVRTTKCVN
jgi:hypothetical protein